MIRIYSKKFNVSKSSLEYLVKGSSHPESYFDPSLDLELASTVQPADNRNLFIGIFPLYGNYKTLLFQAN